MALDYGNAPGMGPLRQGGVPAPDGLMQSNSESNLPSTKSKAAKSQESDLQLVRDLAAGPSRVKDQGPLYLPKAPREEDENYRTRLQRSVFFNYFGHTARGLTGFVFRKDPVLGDDVPVAIKGTDTEGGQWENIDNTGTHGDVFIRERFYDAMIAGHGAILVEFPLTDGTQSLADEKDGIRPYWVPVLKENILSWRTTVENGRTILTQVVLKECTMIPDGRFGEKEQTRYRVLFREGVVGWELLEINEKKELILVDSGVYGNQTEIPLAEITTCGKRSLFESDPPLLDLAHINLAHYRQWSDHDTSLHLTCVPLLYEAGATPEYDTEGKKIPRVVGPNAMFTYSDPNARLDYASHDGAALGECKKSLEDLAGACANFGMAMLASEKRAAETEKSKEISKSGTDSQLAISARGLQDAVEKALQFHANYLREQDGGSITINREYNDVLMEPNVMTAYATLIGLGFNKEIALQMMKLGGRLPEDTDIEAEAMAWEAAMQAEKEAKRLEMEQQSDDMAEEAKKAA
jgi:hypothetical protein